MAAGAHGTSVPLPLLTSWVYGTSEVVPFGTCAARRMKVADPRTIAGRAFVRSLNILLKFARLYGFEHSRTVEQLETAWNELHAAIPIGSDAGLLLAATGAQLLLDGVPLEGSPAEKQFAQLLSAAGLGSVQFFPAITQQELSRFVCAFPTGKSKPSELALQLKSALSGVQGIRINEICFVATDSRMKDAGVAAQLAAVSFGEGNDQFKRLLNDPQKLLEIIAAAEGAKGTADSAGANGRTSGGSFGVDGDAGSDGPDGGPSGHYAAEALQLAERDDSCAQPMPMGGSGTAAVAGGDANGAGSGPGRGPGL